MIHDKIERRKVSRKPDPETAPPHIRRQLQRSLENDPQEIQRKRRERARFALNKAHSVSDDGGPTHKRRRKRRSDAGKPRGKRGRKPSEGTTVSADSHQSPEGVAS